jgi:hypothetical protein
VKTLLHALEDIQATTTGAMLQLWNLVQPGMDHRTTILAFVLLGSCINCEDVEYKVVV